MESNSSLCLGLYDDEDGLEILEVYNDGVSVGPQGVKPPLNLFDFFYIYSTKNIYIGATCKIIKNIRLKSILNALKMSKKII